LFHRRAGGAGLYQQRHEQLGGRVIRHDVSPDEGFTLETQHFPDSPKKPNFLSTVLKPGQDFHSTTIFRFATDAPLPPLLRVNL